MAILRFGITKKEHEWDKILRLIQKKNGGRKHCVKGDGFNQFINNETSRVLQGLSCESSVVNKLRHVKKHFQLNLAEEDASKIKCLAAGMGISPGALIIKLILDPHLLEK